MQQRQQDQIKLQEGKWYLTYWLKRDVYTPIKIIELNVFEDYLSFHFLDENQRFTEYLARIEETIQKGPFDSPEELREHYPEYFI